MTNPTAEPKEPSLVRLDFGKHLPCSARNYRLVWSINLINSHQFAGIGATPAALADFTAELSSVT
jgi:hypothetical protein